MTSRSTAGLGAGFIIVCGLALAAAQDKTLSLRLGPVVEIGRADQSFGSIASVCEDDELNIYVLDRKEFKVSKFSPQGKRLLAFGQKGQGPGDFQAPAGVVFTPQKELAVIEDISYVSYFRKDGTFLRRLDLNGRLGLGYIGPDRFYGWIWRPEDKQQVMVDGKNIILTAFHAVERNSFSTTLPDETGRRVMFNYSHEVYTPMLLFGSSGSLAALGISDRYEITVLDGNGGVAAVIRRPVQALKIGRKERDRFEREVAGFVRSKGWPDSVRQAFVKKIPPAKNLIVELRTSPDRIFVFRHAGEVDVFDRGGGFLGTARLDAVPICVSAASMYFDRTDESGNVYLERREYTLRTGAGAPAP